MKNNKSIFLIITTSLVLFSCSTHQPKVSTIDDIKIFFNDSAARYVLKNPANALYKERDSIWRIFEGYRITLIWHKESSFPVTWDIWEKGLNKFINKDTSLIRKSIELSDNLKLLEEREHDKIVQHISAYLPKKTVMNAYVYFVAFTVPYAFCVEKNKIGIDITGDEWHFNSECLLNTTIHEIYHIGFRFNSPDNKYRETDPFNKETFIRFNYAYLQSEGMATYVGYKALNLFPSSYKHDDYYLIEDDKKVKTAISQVNSIIKRAETLPIDSLNKEAWNIGVEERAYYVAGACIAGKIEEKYGNEYLADLVKKGSIQFVKEYNAIVSDDYKITLIEF